MKRIAISILSLLLCAAMLFGMASCAAPVQAGELSGSYTRNEERTAELSPNFSTAMADFSMEMLHKTLPEDGKNHLISPLSAILCLALVANGAEGNTLSQMEAAFGLDLETLNQSLYAYTSSLPDLEGCKMQYANSIWFRDTKRLRVEEDFLQTNADWYGAQVYRAPFDESTVKEINGWVKEHTDGMIDSVVNGIAPSTIMYLINALVFDAKWQKEYEKKDIRDATFTNRDGSTAEVEMMYSDEATYLKGENFTGFAKTYKGGAYKFVGLLPSEGVDVYELAHSLDGEGWMAMWNGKRSAAVEVGIPEFTYETSINLVKPLTAMGMTDMFDGSRADFSGLGTSEAGNIYCGNALQKTFVEVSRNGTKAAAVTVIEMDEAASAAPIEVRRVILDRPFVYAIVDNATGLPLFVGTVTQLG